MQYTALVTGCRTEWLIHSLLLQGFLACIIYVSINISRVQLVGAVCRLSWKILVPHGLTFVGTCTVTGKPTAEIKTKLKEAAYDSIRSFRTMAFLMLAFAVLIHLPYLLILTFLSTPVPPWDIR
jgi:hypothetical protein